jgi:hypothetical protein
MRRVFLAKFLRAFVGGIADGDQLDIRVALQSREMTPAHDFTRAHDSEPQFVIIFVAHDCGGGIGWNDGVKFI